MDKKKLPKGSVDRFKDRLESTLRHWPISINKKLIESFNLESYIGHYRHYFNPTAREEKSLLENCENLKQTYDALNETLGEETFIGDWFKVDQTCINQFADVTKDKQWIHTDPERAEKESPFKTTISHGFLTLALIPHLTDSISPKKELYPEARLIVNCGLNHVRFTFPIKVNKRIRARTRVIKLVPMKQSLEIVREVTIEIENVKRSACIAETVLRLYF